MARERRRLALLLQYDGSAFAGSQRQPGPATVQSALEDAVEALTGERAPVSFAGRTDAGVHAIGQVASFETSSDLDPRRFARGLNHFLPPEAAVQDAREVAPEFDPRRCAIEREYRYALYAAPQRQPLREARAWVVNGRFCAERARAAAALFEGEHDFAAFTKPETGRSTRRNVRVSRLIGDGPAYEYRTVADAFLQHQVRRMAGAIVEAAAGRLSISDVERLLSAAEPGSAGPTAPARALTLTAVRYDGGDLRDWTGRK